MYYTSTLRSRRSRVRSFAACLLVLFTAILGWRPGTWPTFAVDDSPCSSADHAGDDGVPARAPDAVQRLDSMSLPTISMCPAAPFCLSLTVPAIRPCNVGPLTARSAPPDSLLHLRC